MKTNMDTHLSTLPKQRSAPRYYQLVNNGVVLVEHDSPSLLQWWKGKHNLQGIIKGKY